MLIYRLHVPNVMKTFHNTFVKMSHHAADLFQEFVVKVN
jgi:hypothetical protein